MPQTLQAILSLPPAEQIQPLLGYADSLSEAMDAGERPDIASVVSALMGLVDSGEGSCKDRLQLGEVLGRLGDPRLAEPSDTSYWSTVELDQGPVKVARFPVTIAEFKRFVSAGGYTDDALWDEEGIAWRDGASRLWPELASRDSVTHLTIPNQPVVGVSWHEAQAYARWADARLLTFGERMEVARGTEKRPYPWGAPFGRGNANTREEVLGKPSAVGIFPKDCTPEGVCDLAGNVAEWTSDRVGDECVIHPGSWEQDSMAAWAKARSLEPARTRGADLGFRLARD